MPCAARAFTLARLRYACLLPRAFAAFALRCVCLALPPVWLVCPRWFIAGYAFTRLLLRLTHTGYWFLLAVLAFTRIAAAHTALRTFIACVVTLIVDFTLYYTRLPFTRFTRYVVGYLTTFAFTLRL